MVGFLIYCGTLAILAGVCFVQNMAFTASSRSRNSADPEYHRRVAWASNGVYLIAQLLVWKHLWAAFTIGTLLGWLSVIPMCVIYVLCTAEGSVYMMRRMLASEKGARAVGASELVVRCLCDEFVLPKRATDGSAGFDLRADFEGDLLSIAPGERIVISTGVIAAIPENHVGLIAIRSGLGVHGLRLINSLGVIDSDYRGEIKVGLVNESDISFSIAPLDRIAQLLVVPVPAARFEQGPVSFTKRGEGGFGSTGR